MNRWLILTGLMGMVFGTSAYAAESRILFIGDSHSVGTFGKTLDASLRGLPEAKVATYASCGSSPIWWINGHETPCGWWSNSLAGVAEGATHHPTPILQTLLADIKPTVTLIAQGANLFSAPVAWSEQTSRQLLDVVKASGTRCIWIGPPHARVFTTEQIKAFYDMIIPLAREYHCDLIDSRPFAHYPDTGGDGLHYDQLGAPGVAMAKQWAGSVFAEVERLLSAGN